MFYVRTFGFPTTSLSTLLLLHSAYFCEIPFIGPDLCYLFIDLFLFCQILVIVCALFSVCVVHMSCMWWSEDNLQEELLSAHRLGSQDGTQILKLSPTDHLSSPVSLENKGAEATGTCLISTLFFFSS